MRTALNLAEDVLLAVKERARRGQRSVGEILSELARQALTGQGRSCEPDDAVGSTASNPSRIGVWPSRR